MSGRVNASTDWPGVIGLSLPCPPWTASQMKPPMPTTARTANSGNQTLFRFLDERHHSFDPCRFFDFGLLNWTSFVGWPDFWSTRDGYAPSPPLLLSTLVWRLSISRSSSVTWSLRPASFSAAAAS